MTQEEQQTRIKNILTDDFLVHLTEVAKLYGCVGDYIEIENFVRDCYGVMGKPTPDLVPYEISD